MYGNDKYYSHKNRYIVDDDKKAKAKGRETLSHEEQIVQYGRAADYNMTDLTEKINDLEHRQHNKATNNAINGSPSIYNVTT